MFKNFVDGWITCRYFMSKYLINSIYYNLRKNFIINLILVIIVFRINIEVPLISG